MESSISIWNVNIVVWAIGWVVESLIWIFDSTVKKSVSVLFELFIFILIVWLFKSVTTVDEADKEDVDDKSLEKTGNDDDEDGDELDVDEADDDVKYGWAITSSFVSPFNLSLIFKVTSDVLSTSGLGLDSVLSTKLIWLSAADETIDEFVIFESVVLLLLAVFFKTPYWT